MHVPANKEFSPGKREARTTTATALNRPAVAAIVPRETKQAKRSRARRIAAALGKAYPESTCALLHDSPFQLLAATVLSAQTTDLAVNKATRVLFVRFPTAEAMAAAPPDAIESIINGIGLWRNKSKNLRELSHRLGEDFRGQVPRTIAELTTLPGVGRKTATAVLGTAFGLAAGITVDTHMLRINRLLGLSRSKEPETMAAELETLLPPAEWPHYTHKVIDHGRIACVANRPRCGVCVVAKACPSAFSAGAGYKPANDLREPPSAKGLSWLQHEVPA